MMDLNFPTDYKIRDQKKLLHIMANYFAKFYLGKSYCHGDIPYFSTNFIQNNIIICMSDAELSPLLLSTVVNSVTHFICLMAVCMICNIKMKPSDWVKPIPLPRWLAKINRLRKFAQFIIFYNGIKYYITNLKYFSQPTMVIQKYNIR